MPATHNKTYNSLLLITFIAIWIVSCINPPYPSDLLIQHILTVLLVLGILTTSHAAHALP